MTESVHFQHMTESVHFKLMTESVHFKHEAVLCHRLECNVDVVYTTTNQAEPLTISAVCTLL